MSNTELNQRLKQIKTEDYIWIIYVGIIILSWYSNNVERKYLIYNDLNSKEEYRKIMITIFTILIVVYLYFLKGSVEDLKNLKPNDSYYRKKLVYLSFLASLFIACSGFILLYIAVVDGGDNVEIAFN